MHTVRIADVATVAEETSVTFGKAHFGSNLVTTTGGAISEEDGLFRAAIAQAGITDLRYPGGSVTEEYFDMTRPNATEPTYAPGEAVVDGLQLLPMQTFLENAGELGVGVTLVIPTAAGFRDSDGEALVSSAFRSRPELYPDYQEEILELADAEAYGIRRQLAPDYLSNVIAYVDAAIDGAELHGTRISTFEIGNEFWGSGRMTASEYGYLAARVATAIEARLVARGYDADIMVQTTLAASALYSPAYETQQYIQWIDGVPIPRTGAWIIKNYGTIDPDQWMQVLVPGQGSASDQGLAIIEQLNAYPGAADAVDIATMHYYEAGGFDSIDVSRTAWPYRFLDFDRHLERSEGLPPVARALTEWNTRANVYTRDPDTDQLVPDPGANNRGLQHAAMIHELMYHLAENGVSQLNYWPLNFLSTQNVTLIDRQGEALTIVGTMFGMLSESLVGLTPAFDYDTQFDDAHDNSDFDVHGLAGDGRMTVLVAERSGVVLEDLVLDLAGTLHSAYHFVTTTLLWDGGAGGMDHTAVPELAHVDGKMTASAQVALTLRPWEIARVEITSATDGAETFRGRGGADMIIALGGNDTLLGAAGDDTLVGGAGNDFLDGGDGWDTADYSGHRFDDAVLVRSTPEELLVYLPNGTDTLLGIEELVFDDLNAETASLVTTPGVILGNTEANTLLGDAADNLILAGAGEDTIDGGDGNDTIFAGADRDLVIGGAGDDLLHGEDNADTINGGDGNDTIIGGSTPGDLRDVIYGGAGNDVIDGGAGNDEIYGMDGNDTIAGGFGVDEIQGQEGDDVITGSAFSDLIFGGAGNDFVNGGFGHDRVNGGSGADRFYHLGIFDHGSDWIQDYSAAEGDVLLFGDATASRADFQVNFAHTSNAAGERAGDDAIREAFVTYRPTGQIIWALVDGEGQSQINLKIDADLFDLLA